MKNKPLVIVIVLMLLGLAAFGAIYMKKHSAKQDVPDYPASADYSKASTAASKAAATPYTPPPAAVAKDLAVEPVFYLQQHMKGLERGITAALNRQKIKLADLEKLYFGGNDAPDPAYAVFNPNGLIRFRPEGGKWFGQDLVDRVAKVKGTKLVYNLRRITDAKGKVTDVLYALIPNANASSCGPAAGNAQYVYGGTFRLAKDNSTIVEDTPDTPIMQNGCLMDSTHTLTWVYRIKLRTQAGPNKAWGSF